MLDTYVSPLIEGEKLTFRFDRNSDKVRVNYSKLYRDQIIYDTDYWKESIQSILKVNKDIKVNGIVINNTLWITSIEHHPDSEVADPRKFFKVLSSLYTTDNLKFLRSTKCTTEEGLAREICLLQEEGFGEIKCSTYGG